MSAIRAAVEDIRRHRDDRAVNSTSACVLRGTEFLDGTQWKDLKVGDLVRVEGDAFFPADLLLVNSSEVGKKEGGKKREEEEEVGSVAKKYFSSRTEWHLSTR